MLVTHQKLSKEIRWFVMSFTMKTTNESNKKIQPDPDKRDHPNQREGHGKQRELGSMFNE